MRLGIQASPKFPAIGPFRLMRVFNFSPGPAVLPEEVLERAREELLDWHGTGMSVMEMSHRSKEFIAIAEAAEKIGRASCRERV